MKRTLLAVFLYAALSSCSSSHSLKNNLRFFDENNIEISRSRFYNKCITNAFLIIHGDSANHKKLVVRERGGKINNRALLESALEKATGRQIDSLKPIVVIYYPGKDSCNNSGTADKEWIQNWYAQLENGLDQIAKVKPLYICKSKIGLEKYEGIIDWKKDPGAVIERLFFSKHYPGGSFVVISKNGEYMSYFGEFPKEYVWNATQRMLENTSKIADL